jgi:hypothetical protein
VNDRARSKGAGATKKTVERSLPGKGRTPWGLCPQTPGVLRFGHREKTLRKATPEGARLSVEMPDLPLMWTGHGQRKRCPPPAHNRLDNRRASGRERESFRWRLPTGPWITPLPRPPGLREQATESLDRRLARIEGRSYPQFHSHEEYE